MKPESGVAAALFALACACTTTVPQHHSVRRPTRDGADEFQRMIWSDENGRILPGAYARALDQAAAIRKQPRPDRAGVSRNSWTWLGPGNVGGRITSILVHPTDPNLIWVNNPGGGIWKSANAGTTFQPVNDFLANLAVSTMAMSPADPKVMYAGTGGGAGASTLRGAGIFKSSDGGETWTQLPATTAADWSGGVEKISISPDGNSVLAATKAVYSDVASAIWRSTDGGNTWTEALKQTGGMEGWVVEFHPTDNSRAIASTKTGQAVYSTDGGANWNAATGIPPEGLIAVAYARSNPTIVYAGLDSNGGDIYKSTDGGQTYTRVNTGTGYLGEQGWYSNVVWVDPTNANHVLISGLDIYRSTDGGASFTQISQWQKSPRSAHADHGAIAAASGYGTSNQTILFGNDGGLYRAQDITTVEAEAGWEVLNNNLGVTQIYGAAGNPINGVIMAGTQDNGSVRYDGDAQKWSRWEGGDGGFVAADPNDPNFFYGEYVYLTIYRSDDGGFARPEDVYGFYNFWNGASWEKKARSSPITEAKSGTANFIAPFIMDPNEPNRLLAGARSLWVTNDAKKSNKEGGPSWAIIKPGTGNARVNNISAIAVAKGNSNVIWVGHNNGDIFTTSNGLASSPSWTKVDDGSPALPNRFVTRIVVDPSDSRTAYATFGGFSANNLWRTTDAGATWTSITGPLPQAPIETLAIHPKNSKWLYAGTEVGLFTSEDGGATWAVPQDGPANVSVKELFFLNNTLYAATFGRGMYKVDIPNTPAKTAQTCYTLTIQADDGSRGGILPDVAPNCDGGRAYTAGTIVRLKARARAPHSFAGWSGDIGSNGVVTMTGNRIATGHFTPSAACYPLTISITPLAAGKVTTIPPPNCGSGYVAGTEVIFVATPTAPYAFGGWGGAYFGPDPVGAVEMDEPLAITAIFALPATNDEIANAIEIRGSTSFLLDTSASGNSPDDPVVCEAGKSGKTVWFRMTPTEDAPLRIDTNGSNYHTVIQIYTGQPGALNAIACSAEALPGTPISELSDSFDLATDELAGIQIKARKGTTYYIEIGDATEPDPEGAEFDFTDDFKDFPDGGLLQVNVVFGNTRGRVVRH
ncbi:MAG TPA: hypothetical protein VER58_05650 [Thermoanaerobaculia bacterium]|nr:hypothetical protein [Thermoanaerobaculia bacterium]